MTDTSLPAAAGLGTFERWLSVWVGLAIGTGLLLGNLFPGLFSDLASLEVASVNLPVAVLIWAMVYPMMVGMDFPSEMVLDLLERLPPDPMRKEDRTPLIDADGNGIRGD